MRKIIVSILLVVGLVAGASSCHSTDPLTVCRASNREHMDSHWQMVAWGVNSTGQRFRCKGWEPGRYVCWYVEATDPNHNPRNFRTCALNT